MFFFNLVRTWKTVLVGFRCQLPSRTEMKWTTRSITYHAYKNWKCAVESFWESPADSHESWCSDGIDSVLQDISPEQKKGRKVQIWMEHPVSNYKPRRRHSDSVRFVVFYKSSKRSPASGEENEESSIQDVVTSHNLLERSFQSRNQASSSTQWQTEVL